MILRDAALLAVAVVSLATALRMVDSWRKEARLQRRLSSLQQLVIALERERGNTIDLDDLPSAVADQVRTRLFHDGTLVVLSATQELQREAANYLRLQGQSGPVCVLIEGTHAEVTLYAETHRLDNLRPIAVVPGSGERLWSRLAVPFMVEVRTGIAVRATPFGLSHSMWPLESKNRGGTSAGKAKAEIMEPTGR